MSHQNLRTKYGGNAKMAIRRAIRAECPGGVELLDLIELVSHMRGRDAVPAAVETRLNEVRDRMAEWVIARNGKEL